MFINYSQYITIIQQDHWTVDIFGFYKVYAEMNSEMYYMLLESSFKRKLNNFQDIFFYKKMFQGPKDY